MGRPRKQIDAKQFEGLCALQCTKEEISDWFNCSEDTIERWCHDKYGVNFAVVFKQKRAGGKISLRRAQWKLAEKSPAMAIFLGKNYLGQKDSFEINENEALNKLDEVLAQIGGVD